MKPRRPWDDASFRQRRALLMASVNASTRCWRCGKLAQEHPPHADGKPGRWQAGHVVDGSNLGPLALEHSTCNAAAGGRLGAQRRHARRVAPHHPMHHDLVNAAAVTAPPCIAAQGALCSTCAAHRGRN
jgi:hypothetical protein